MTSRSAGVSHEGDVTIIATLSPIFLLAKHLNRCILPLLRYAASSHSDDDIEPSHGRVAASVPELLT